MTHIMIASARKEVCKLFERLLWKPTSGFTNASSLDKCIRQLGTLSPELLIVDGEIDTPDRCFELLAELKESPGTEELPIVVLNDPERDGEEKSRLLLVADDHIPEPFNPGEVKTIVEQFL